MYGPLLGLLLTPILLSPDVGTPQPPVLPIEDKLWLKPYVDLQAYEDPAQGALDFTRELDPAWLMVDTVIGEGESRCAPQQDPPVGQHRATSRPLPSSASLGSPAGFSGPRVTGWTHSLLCSVSSLNHCVLVKNPSSGALEQPLSPTHLLLWFWSF